MHERMVPLLQTINRRKRTAVSPEVEAATSKYDRSHLFLVRLWCEEPSEGVDPSTGPARWHGKVQHIVSGRAEPFDDWQRLVAFFHTTLPLDPNFEGSQLLGVRLGPGHGIEQRRE